MIDKTKLQFLVGTADNGETVYGDFQTTGHFISSGHVGSGHASYDEGAFVTFLIQNYTPDDLQFIMIDPKMVQLTPYEGIPHLLQPVIFNPEDARDAVVDLLGEMDRRFNLLADSGVKNITEHNARSDDKLPFIILLCTEIADLMMVDGEVLGDSEQKSDDGCWDILGLCWYWWLAIIAGLIALWLVIAAALRRRNNSEA